MKAPLATIAHTRSGDKGDTSNIGVIALRPEHYRIIVREVTAERVKAFFGDLVRGEVERFELPNLGAINLLLHEALGRRHRFPARRRPRQDLRSRTAPHGDRP